MSKQDDLELLLAQYKAVSDQIIHWDTFFWKKATVFFTLESLTLFGVGNKIIDATSKHPPSTLSGSEFLIYGVAILLNLYMCVVWLRTGICNRNYLGSRFYMGGVIEDYFKFNAFTLYTYQGWKRAEEMKSHRWEIGMPLVFEFAWLVVLSFLTYLYYISFYFCKSLPIWVVDGILLYLLGREALSRIEELMMTPEEGVNDCRSGEKKSIWNRIKELWKRMMGTHQAGRTNDGNSNQSGKTEWEWNEFLEQRGFRNHSNTK